MIGFISASGERAAVTARHRIHLCADSVAEMKRPYLFIFIYLFFGSRIQVFFRPLGNFPELLVVSCQHMRSVGTC